MADDYGQLGLGGLTSLIKDVKLSAWGNRVTLECLYNPEAPYPYLIVFDDCREVDWSLHDLDNLQEPFADLIGIHLGCGNHQRKALIHTDIFDLSLLYGNWQVYSSP